MKLKRSTGSGWIATGEFCGIATVLTALATVALEPYSGLWWACIGLTAGLFNLTLLALVTGSLLRAVWFLPGDPQKDGEPE